MKQYRQRPVIALTRLPSEKGSPSGIISYLAFLASRSLEIPDSVFAVQNCAKSCCQSVRITAGRKSQSSTGTDAAKTKAPAGASASHIVISCNTVFTVAGSNDSRA